MKRMAWRPCFGAKVLFVYNTKNIEYERWQCFGVSFYFIVYENKRILNISNFILFWISFDTWPFVIFLNLLLSFAFKGMVYNQNHVFYRSGLFVFVQLQLLLPWFKFFQLTCKTVANLVCECFMSHARKSLPWHSSCT